MGSGKGQSVGKGVGELRTVLRPRSGFDKPTFLQFPSQFERERGTPGKDECGEPLWKVKVKVDNKIFMSDSKHHRPILTACYCTEISRLGTIYSSGTMYRLASELNEKVEQ